MFSPISVWFTDMAHSSLKHNSWSNVWSDNTYLAIYLPECTEIHSERTRNVGGKSFCYPLFFFCFLIVLHWEQRPFDLPRYVWFVWKVKRKLLGINLWGFDLIFTTNKVEVSFVGKFGCCHTKNLDTKLWHPFPLIPWLKSGLFAPFNPKITFYRRNEWRYDFKNH